MPEQHQIVINTGPLIALIAATGDLRILERRYSRLVVPLEVAGEILVEGLSRFGAAEFQAASWLQKKESPMAIRSSLAKSLGPGEAAVIECALTEGIGLVAIDVAVGRRVARLNGLSITGSLGILVRAKRDGCPITLREAIDSMRANGIWLSESLAALALNQAGE